MASPTASQLSAMNRCLRLGEILSNVFRFVSEDARDRLGDLASLARTSKAFNEVAEPVLWRMQSTLAPLAKCLPLDGSRNTTQSGQLVTELLPTWCVYLDRSDWLRFLHYAPYVRRLGFYDPRLQHQPREIVDYSAFDDLDISTFPNNIRDIHSSSDMNMSHVPNKVLLDLHALRWSEGPDTSKYIRLFLGPNLTTVVLALLDGHKDEQIVELLPLLERVAPQLRQLVLYQPISGVLVTEAMTVALSQLVCKVEQMRSFLCDSIPITEAASRHLAGLPFLRELDVATPSEDMYHHLRSPTTVNDAFPALGALSLPSVEEVGVRPLLKLDRMPMLRDMVVRCMGPPSASPEELEDMFQLFRGLDESRGFHSLSFVWKIPPAPPNILGGEYSHTRTTADPEGREWRYHEWVEEI